MCVFDAENAHLSPFWTRKNWTKCRNPGEKISPKLVNFATLAVIFNLPLWFHFTNFVLSGRLLENLGNDAVFNKNLSDL